MGLWELVSLELDQPGKRIGEYFEKTLKLDIKRVSYRKERDYVSKDLICRMVNKALGKGPERKLVFYGSDYYHHFTYGLCKHADRFNDSYAYVHFDHHSDCFNGGIKSEISCGSFVDDILKDSNASAVLFLGSRPPIHTDFSKKACISLLEEQLRHYSFRKLEKRLSKLPDEVYLSFDLDVMSEGAITTAYNQGTLQTKELMKILDAIKRTKRIIGDDILGYGDIEGKEIGKELYAKIARSLLQA